MNKAIYRQTDKRWASLPYPTKSYTFGGSGCGCCAVTHCIIEIDKHKNYTPADTRPFMVQYATKGNGTLRTGITAGLKHWGLTDVKRLQSDPMSVLWAECEKGGRVGVLLFGSRKGPDGTVWTAGGHYVAFVDYKKDKNGRHWLYMKDSGGRHHDGWWCYETSMRGDVVDAWCGKLPAESKKKRTEYKVIDVSAWQGTIDWPAVKASGVVGAIIRYADGTTLDSHFDTNMKRAKAAGLHIGSYIFSRATTTKEAEKEATRLYNACKQYDPDMPLYIDLEVNANAKKADAIAAAFLDKMKALGGKGGVYANYHWWTNYLTGTAKNYSSHPFWIAQYNDTMDYKPASRMGMWQYTSSGSVKGISGRVDLDKCYIAYWDKKQKPEPPKKSIDEVAHEVIEGKWGSGAERKRRLIEAGYDYDAVQARVNEILAEKHKYAGEMPTTKLVKSSQEVISDAIRFANWIVSDNRFGYGRMGGSKYEGTPEYSITHSGGCHFCGSNATKIAKAKKAGLKNPEEWEYTYVCNTFVHAAYAHAGVPSMLSAKGHSWWTGSYQKSKYWTEIKKPSKITDCKPGDVFAWDTHFCLYLGDGQGAEATSCGNAASSKSNWSKSIRKTSFSNHFKKAKHVFRLTGSVNTTAVIRYGEVGKRVEKLQRYMIWYGYAITADGIFGDQTLACVKDMQKKLNLTADGIVGPATLAAMAEVTK